MMHISQFTTSLVTIIFSYDDLESVAWHILTENTHDCVSMLLNVK